MQVTGSHDPAVKKASTYTVHRTPPIVRSYCVVFEWGGAETKSVFLDSMELEFLLSVGFHVNPIQHD